MTGPAAHDPVPDGDTLADPVILAVGVAVVVGAAPPDSDTDGVTFAGLVGVGAIPPPLKKFFDFPNFPVSNTHMPKSKVIKISKRLRNAFAGEKSRSDAVVKAISEATLRPQKMAFALKARLSEPPTPDDVNDQRIHIYFPEKSLIFIKELADMSKLSDEEVVRLCMEAYIKHL